MPKDFDIEVTNEGSVFTFRPLNEPAYLWMRENISTEPWQWLGGSLAVGQHYVKELASLLEENGFVLGP